jgi:hypothetical protein
MTLAIRALLALLVESLLTLVPHQEGVGELAEVRRGEGHAPRGITVSLYVDTRDVHPSIWTAFSWCECHAQPVAAAPPESHPLPPPSDHCLPAPVAAPHPW